MREYFTYGSVRRAAGNGGPYRDRRSSVMRHRGSSRADLRVTNGIGLIH
jgi:hypothetical protein